MQDTCSVCGKGMKGGMWTNGDGFGDGKYVGLDVGNRKPYCWDCYEEGKAPDHNKDIDKAFKERQICGFLEAFVGRCRSPEPCEKHSHQTC